MMLPMMAAELVATGACEMFWFHGLSAGNRLVPRSVPRAVAIGIAMAQLKTKPPTNCILHQQAIQGLSHIDGERATRAGGLWGLRALLGTTTTRYRRCPSPRLRGEGQGEGFVACEAWASSPQPSPPKEERESGRTRAGSVEMRPATAVTFDR